MILLFIYFAGHWRQHSVLNELILLLLLLFNVFTPELFPYVSWCYSNHQHLWHKLGELVSASGVQQGDPLGPLLFSLVLHATVQAIVADPQCTDLTSNCWCLDDGVLAGTRASLIRALEVIQEHSVSSGLSLNYSKCESYSLQNLDMFYHTISRSATPCFEILGAPIGTTEFCVEYIQKKIAEARQLLHLLPQLCETQVALSLLRMCGSFCKMAHLARTTPPSTDILECFIKFDRDSLHCLETSALIALSPSAVKQAQLSMSFGGLGLRSTAMHAPAAYIASVSHASSLEPNFINSSQVHLDMAVSTFNNLVPPSESISTADVLDSKPKQRLLSQKIEEAGFSSLIQESSTAVKARLRAVSQPQAHAWLRATPIA